MTKRIISAIMCILLLASLFPASAEMLAFDSPQGSSYTFAQSSGSDRIVDRAAGSGTQVLKLAGGSQTVCEYDYDVPQGGVSVIILIRPGCANCRNTVSEVAASDWAGREDISLVIADIGGGSAADTAAFVDECAGADASDFTVFAQANYIGSKYGALVGESSFTTPLILLVTEEGGEKCIQKYSTGYVSAQALLSSISQCLLQDSELAKVTVSGTRLYDEIEYGFEGINASRSNCGLDPLSFSAELSELAMIRAQELALSYGSTRPDGSGFETVFGACSAGTKVGESRVF